MEEYGPELHYIKGENNVVADALSRLDIVQGEDQNPEQPPDLGSTYFRGLVDNLDYLLNMTLEAITKRDKVV